VVKVGDEVRVKVILIDDQGRVKLSRKQALLEENANTEGEQEPAATSGNR
jgi:predicted RNA-binding protein with RPS1 domain